MVSQLGVEPENPQIMRTTGARLPVSGACFPLVRRPMGLLSRPPVSACGCPIVCQPEQDQNWNASVRQRFGESGVLMVQTPFQAAE